MTTEADFVEGVAALQKSDFRIGRETHREQWLLGRCFKALEISEHYFYFV